MAVRVESVEHPEVASVGHAVFEVSIGRSESVAHQLRPCRQSPGHRAPVQSAIEL